MTASPPHIPLAIVGLGCRLPGADSPTRFMHQSLEGQRAFSLAPVEWHDGLGVSHPLWGGFVPEEGKDWKLFRLPPTHVEKMHRMERLLHLTLLQATQDAGYSAEKGPGGRCAIYLGSTGLGVDQRTDQSLRLRTPEFREHLALALLGHPDAARLIEAVERHVDRHAPPILSETVPMTATLVANRLSSLLDTRGGHLAVDAGTASSMAALRLASLSLQLGQCDVAVVGAVSPLVSPSTFGLLAARGWLADEQEVLALDGRAMGTLPGEGAVALVLCRLDDALADQQRIYAVLHGVASEVNLKQGLSRLSRMVDRAARSCLDLAGVEAEQVRHVEVQACGVVGLEDQELLGLKSALAAARPEALTFSTAVPQVGFQQAASGLVSVMRAALSLHGGVRAPVAGLTSPRHSEPGVMECLMRPEKLSPQAYVGVSSLGWSNIAYHALLGPAPGPDTWTDMRPIRPPAQKYAIVGMGAVAPGAPDAPSLWTNIISKADAIGDLPLSRFDVHHLLGVLMSGEELVPRLAGTVDLPAAEPRWLKLPPTQAAALDPSVPLFVKAAEEALTQARHEPGAWNGRRVQVLVGQLPTRCREFELELRFVCERYLRLAAEALRAQGMEASRVGPLLDAVRQGVVATLPPLDENATQYYSGLAGASRLAALHDFSGGVMTVDAACASSIAAVHAGLLALANRDADVVVAGGVAYNLFPEYSAALAVLGFLSPRGTFPFDDRADGFVPAEGAGAVVIKRLEDAEAQKDRILAVIAGIGFSSDGRGTSLFAPNPKGQARAVERALQDAKIPPDQIGLLEAHGTGTKVGDLTEAMAYGEAFQTRGRDNPVPMGTLKSQIGHTSSASGALALIKTVFAVSEAFLPPMNGGEFPKADIHFDKLPIALSLEGRPWPMPREGRRRAGVSSFGAGGTNYHVILEEHDNSHRRTQVANPLGTTSSYPIPSRGLTAQRWSVDLVPLSLSSARRYPLVGRKLLLVGDEPGLVAAFSRLLVSKGVRLSTVSVAGITDALEVERYVRRASEDLGGADGVIDLGCFGPLDYFLTLGSTRFARRMAETTARWHGTGRALYERWRDLPGRTGCYVAVTSMGGDFGFLGDGGNVTGGAITGFLKGLKQELPGMIAKTVDFEPRASHWVVAETVARELEEGSDRTEVGYLASRRFVVGLRRADFSHEEGQVLRHLDPSWVLLFSGGGRGAVFEVAKAVARLGPKVIVTGRTPTPTGDEPFLALDDTDFESYRRQEMLRRKKEDPSLTVVRFNEAFEASVRARELWRNLQEVYAQGLSIEYETCDVRNNTDVRAMVDRVREYHGHLDGIVHGAMVESSKSLPDKTPGLVTSTLEVKVLGLTNLLEATRRDDLKLMMCFGSGAARFGNKGQTDYSAANELMSKCAMAYAHRSRPQMRCVTIDWTAWEGVGAAGRNREVVQNTGVSFINPSEGAYWFINELLQGRTEREVAIFEERLFREWPFLGAAADGPDARTVYDDRGFLLVPSDYPMVDSVEQHDAQGLIASRTFDLTTDPFVLQHQLDSVPIMPGTFGFEMLGETAALFRPDLAVLRAENLRIETPLKFFKAPLVGERSRGKPIHVTLTAKVLKQEGDEVTLYVESSSDLALGGRSEQTQRRIHQQGLYVLGPPPPEEPGTGQFPEALPGSRARSIFHLAKEPLYLGPLFCRAEWVYVGATEVEGIIRAPRQREIFTHVARPRFQLDPLLLDAAFQVAANWDGHHNNLVSVPMGVETLVRGRQRKLGESGHVKARMTRVEGEDVLYDFEVRGEDGAVLLGGTGLWFRRLRRSERRFTDT